MLESKKEIPDAQYTADIIRQAPVMILVYDRQFDDPYQSIAGEQHIYEICNTLSVGACIENMILEAQNMGIGSLWIANHFFAYWEIRQCVGKNMQLLSMVAFGYPDQQPNRRPRRNLEETVTYLAD